MSARPAKLAVSPGGVAVAVAGLAGLALCLVSGGLEGPLATLCLAPAVAACLLRRRDLLAFGGGASVATTGIAALATVLTRLPKVPQDAAPWLAAAVMLLVALGLAAGLAALRAETLRTRRAGDQADLALRLLEFQPNLLLHLDRSGSILAALGAPLAGPPAALTGRHLGHLVADAELPTLAGALHMAGQPAGLQIELVVGARDQPGGWREITLRRSGDSHLVATVRDAGAQQAREQTLEAARAAAEQRDAGKSRFLANMSHELRTPLNAIMGFSDIMRQRLFGPMADRYAEYAELIHESGSHLLELINDVLDMSKIEAERFELSLERLDAREAMNAVLRLMRGQADRAGVNLRGLLPSQTLEVDADRRALKQIALNLVSNALKFTPKGGGVTLTLQAAAGALELSVADTGVGIAPEDLQRLGRPFEQAGDAGQRAAGSGLGLSLVRAFAELHGGDMVVESVVGSGTTVTVRLPVLAAAEAVALRQA